MDASVAALLGAVVGAVTTLAVTVVTFVFEARREKQRARITNVARVAHALATLQVHMEWIIWLGEHQPQYLTAEEIKDYGEKVMPQFPELLSPVSLIGAYRAALYEQLLAIYRQALQLDEHINARLEGQGPQWPQLRGEADHFFGQWIAIIQQALQGV
jgi:hypothetical protein